MEIVLGLVVILVSLIVVFTALGRLSELISLQRTTVRILAKLANVTLEGKGKQLRLKDEEAVKGA